MRTGQQMPSGYSAMAFVQQAVLGKLLLPLVLATEEKPGSRLLHFVDDKNILRHRIKIRTRHKHQPVARL